MAVPRLRRSFTDWPLAAESRRLCTHRWHLACLTSPERRYFGSLNVTNFGQFRVLETDCFRAAKIMTLRALTAIRLNLAAAPIGRGVGPPLNSIKLPFAGCSLSWQIDWEATSSCVSYTHEQR